MEEVSWMFAIFGIFMNILESRDPCRQYRDQSGLRAGWQRSLAALLV